MRLFSVYAPLALLLFTAVVLSVWSEPLAQATELLYAMSPIGELVFVLLLVAAVVFIPVTVMPLIPLAATVFGPLQTALLSVIGWTVGGVVAFVLARTLGRPLVERFSSLGQVDKFVATIPPHTRFIYIVLLRLTLPVDVVSYGLGLTTGVSLLEYTVATAVGVTWFSFAFAYLGDAFLTGNLWLVLELGLVSLGVFGTAWYIHYRLNKRNN